MNIYLDNGFLNISGIEHFARKQFAPFIVIIGKRQVGKTYGVLERMLKDDRRFILMRRTSEEMKYISIDANNPLRKFDERTEIAPEGKYTCGIYRVNEDATKTHIGMIMALSTVAKVRGFDASQYTDLVYDEAIPETHVVRIHNEQDAFLNAYVTISGNRELEGKPPLRCWILANSNDISAPILDALKITEAAEKLSRTGQEYTLIPDRGILLIMPRSETVTEKRSKTALYRAIGTDNDFARMSLGNEFSYNDDTDVGVVNLKEYRPFIRIGELYIHEHKTEPKLYVSKRTKQKTVYSYNDTEYFINKFRRDFPDCRSLYVSGCVVFQSLAVKAKFVEYVGKL